MIVAGIGRLTRDVEVRYLQNGDMVIGSFSLAVPRKGKDHDKTDFFNCTAFGKTAENIEKYFKKGNKIYIGGTLQTDKYINRDGKEVTATKIVVNDFDFCESKGEQTTESKPKENAGDGFLNIPDSLEEELPFC